MYEANQTIAKKLNLNGPLFLMVMGVLGNYLHYRIFYGVDYIFGSIAGLIAISLYDRKYGILIASVAACYTILLWNHPFGAAALIGEAIFVAMLLRRFRYHLVIASAAYWLVLGIPQIYFYYRFFLHIDHSGALLTSLKQATNGIINAFIANIIVLYTPIAIWFNTPRRPKVTIFQTVFAFLAMGATIPAITIMLINSQKIVQQSEESAKTQLNTISAGISLSAERWLNQYTDILKMTSQISMKFETTNNGLQSLIREIKASSEDFMGIYVSDKNGIATAVSPLTNNNGATVRGMNFSDRPYFVELKETSKDVVVTPVFMGRGGFNQPIVVVSAARRTANGQFTGVVSGALNLNHLTQMLKVVKSNSDYIATVVDENQNVIASTVPERKIMTKFESDDDLSFDEKDLAFFHRWPKEKQPPITRWKNSFMGKVSDIGGGSHWSLYVELPLAYQQNILYSQYIKSLAALLAMLLAVLLFAWWFAEKLSRPLVKLSYETTGLPQRLQHNENIQWPEGTFTEYNTLVENFRAMINILKLQFNDLKSSSQKIEEQTRVMELINKVTQSFQGDLDVKKIVQTVTDSCTELTNAKFGAFFYNVLDSHGERYTLYAISGVDPANFSKFPMPRSTKIFAPTFTGEKTVRYDDVTKEPNYGQNSPYHGMPPGHLPVKSYLAVPVVSPSGEVIGGLFFGHPEPGKFTERSEKVVEGVAAQAAIAMDNARLYDAVKLSENKSKEMAKAQAFLARASSVIGKSLEIDTIVTTLSSLLVPELGDWCSVSVVQPTGSVTQMGLAHKDPSKFAALKKTYQNFSSLYTEYGVSKALRTGQSQLIPAFTPEQLKEIARTQENFELLEQIGVYSYICVPLKVRGNIFGAISICRNSDPQYTENDLQLLEELALRVSTAIDNAKLYKEAQNINRVKDEFLANLSHELRTPLSIILGHSEILKEASYTLGKPDLETSIDAVFRNAQAQNQIVTDLLDVSAIIAGKINFEPVVILPNNIVENAVDSIRLAAEGKDIELDLQLTLEHVKTVGDPTRLQQVVWNLLSNAVKFTPQHGKITVKTKVEGSEFIIEVIDNGQGIEPEFMPYIFDRFRQEDNSLTKKYGGLGLGLSIVRQLVELHGGTIKVSSPGKAQGAVFRVALPLIDIVTHEVKSESTRTDTQSVHLLRNRKILVVDDQEDARELIFRILEKAGATPIMASSAKEALLLYEKENPDLIVSDIGMPVENGFSFLRKLRAIETLKGGFTPAMALTAYAQEKDRQQTLAAGFQAYMAKPVSSSAILQILGDLIEKYLNNVHRP